MEQPIDVIGIGAEGPAGLRPALIERILRAEFLAGGQRHLAYFPDGCGTRLVLKDNLGELVIELSKRLPTQRCVVLASGDPLFYGIGSYLVGQFGPGSVRVEPALSSMQLAFARAGIPWQSAALASVHGRPLRPILLPLLGQGTIGLFTQDGDTPAAVGRFFIQYGLADYTATVGENLGAADERVTRWPNLHELIDARFGPLNYLILQRSPGPEVGRHRALIPGVPDEAFQRPHEKPEVMTRQEVRAVAVAKLVGVTEAGDTAWDLGAGLGTIAVEISVLRPHLEVVAVERDPTRAGFLRQNRERFGAYNIRVVEGAAPEALRGESERPRWSSSAAPAAVSRTFSTWSPIDCTTAAGSWPASSPWNTWPWRWSGCGAGSGVAT